MIDFKDYAPFVRLRSSGAEAPPPCALCGTATDTVADGENKAGELALFVPICKACFEPTPESAPPAPEAPTTV